MQKKVYETPALEEAGSFEDVTLAIQGGAIVDQEFINAVVLGGPVPPGGAFS
ncbi:lasso RiPP family leader peptide-containing protein [Hyphococcus sp.]|uniref:lasso RiPP family leader peptide-containing protein n=1 Tax=Hyphococcus sp. TaxID=2038636 RepID=UPI003D11B719